MTSQPSSDRRPTLREVARVAGLSVTQTSRALNGHDDVAEQTKQRAKEAALAVGYRPNLEARRLKMPDSRAHSLGLVLSSPDQRFSDPFLGDLLAAIARTAADHDFELQLTSTVEHSDADVLERYQRIIATKRVDGFILLRVTANDPRVEFLLERNVPFVTLGHPADHQGFPTVAESPEGLSTAVAHLVDLGHRSIGAVALPAGYAIADQRLVAFRRALDERGLTADVSPPVVPAAGYNLDSGLEAAHRLLGMSAAPTAVIAFNDPLSMGVVRAARDRGLSIPHDLSLVSVDDTFVAAAMSPSLTALRNPAAEYGRILVTELLASIDDGPRDTHSLVLPDFIVRESTAGPA